METESMPVSNKALMLETQVILQFLIGLVQFEDSNDDSYREELIEFLKLAKDRIDTLSERANFTEPDDFPQDNRL